MASMKEHKESLDFVYDFYVKMKRNKINLAYEGEITHQITKAFTSLTETNMVRELRLKDSTVQIPMAGLKNGLIGIMPLKWISGRMTENPKGLFLEVELVFISSSVLTVNG